MITIGHRIPFKGENETDIIEVFSMAADALMAKARKIYLMTGIVDRVLLSKIEILKAKVYRIETEREL